MQSDPFISFERSLYKAILDADINLLKLLLKINTDPNEAPWCRCLGGIACILHTGQEGLTVNTHWQQLHTANPSADDDYNRFIKYNGHTSWQK